MICSNCKGKGKIKRPADEEVFDREVDRLADPGIFTLGESIEMAYKKSGFIWEICPECGGRGEK